MKPSKRIANKFGFVSAILILSLVAGCNIPAASTPTPDLFATLQASTPSMVSTPGILATQIPPVFDLATVTFTALPTGQTSIPSPSPSDKLSGHIVFTCQIFKVQASDQVCIMNADGNDFRRLTTEDSIRHFYPSLAPDGQSVLYSVFIETDNFDLYELELGDGSVNRLTKTYGVETAPEVSPDGKSIVFARWNPGTQKFHVALMSRGGKDAQNISKAEGWDPTWSPDGKLILFASDMHGSVQLYTIKPDGKNLQGITSLPAIRGRSDWSSDGRYIVTYSGDAWKRELYLMNADGSNVHQLTPSGGDSQGPSFSPDGKWIVFTAYFDHPNDDHGCEIYVIRIDGTDLRRLTNNDYCDYQPRWGP